MKREELSEIVAGKVISKEIFPETVNPNELTEPYNEIVRYIKNNNRWSSEDLIQRFGYYALERAEIAARSVNHKVDVDWVALLGKVYVMEDVGQTFARAADDLMGGQDVDPADLVQAAFRLSNVESDVITADRVNPAPIVMKPTFWQPIDAYIGGLPDACLTIVGAAPGTGKTTLLLRLAANAAKNGKKSLIFTMEMTAEQLLYRLANIDNLSKEELARIKICDDILTPNKLAALASKHSQDVHFIGVDFAELMLRADSMSTEAAMSKVYLVMQQTAKILRAPVVLLSQLNRMYVGGLPNITNLRYTGMAETLAAMILLLYNPTIVTATVDNSGILPSIEGRGYIILRKSKFGHKSLPAYQEFAIQVPWDGLTGWGETAAPTLYPV